MKVCDKTCIFCFFPLINKSLCMTKRSLVSERSSYKALNVKIWKEALTSYTAFALVGRGETREAGRPFSQYSVRDSNLGSDERWLGSSQQRQPVWSDVWLVNDTGFMKKPSWWWQWHSSRIPFLSTLVTASAPLWSFWMARVTSLLLSKPVQTRPLEENWDGNPKNLYRKLTAASYCGLSALCQS